MKKLLISLSILMLIIVGCAKDEPKEEVKGDNYGYDMPEDNVITKITVDELVNKMEAEENIFVLFGRVTWPYCVEAVPILNDVATSKKVEIFYINTEEEDITELANEYGIQYVPEVMYFEGKTLVDKMSSSEYEFEAKDYATYYRKVFEALIDNNK